MTQDSPRVVTSQELRRAGVSRLRCVHLGKCTQDAALAKAVKMLADDLRAATVLARNVRLACDFGNGARWGLSDNQIARLRLGETLTLEDSVGRFAIGYSKLEP